MNFHRVTRGSGSRVKRFSVSRLFKAGAVIAVCSTIGMLGLPQTTANADTPPGIVDLGAQADALVGTVEGAINTVLGIVNPALATLEGDLTTVEGDLTPITDDADLSPAVLEALIAVGLIEAGP